MGQHDTAALRLQTQEDRIVREILRLPAGATAGGAPALVGLFDREILPLTLDRRFDTYAHVRDVVQTLGGWPARILMPFVLLETAPTIVSVATVDYCSMGPTSGRDPTFRPNEIVQSIRRGDPRRPGAVLAGLLMLGDPRVCALAAPLRPRLAPHEIEPLARCVGGLAYRCVVEFYLDWLDETVDRGDEAAVALRGHLATGLFRLVTRRLLPDFIDGLRPFPTLAAHAPWGKRIPLDRLAAALRDRLRDLERREEGPKLMPMVLQAFGLAPSGTPEARPVLH